ncbi:MAG: protease inhibitor I42 family protein [Candidatus Nealsonbacteria bacterium]
MLKLIITVFISLLIIVGVSYGASHYIVAPAAENTKDAGIQTIEKEVGEDFGIVLEANPTTGYQWTVEFDEGFIELVDRNYIVQEPTFSRNAMVESVMASRDGEIQTEDLPDGARDIIDSNQVREQWAQDQIDGGVIGIENPEESEMEVPVGAGGQESFEFLALKKGETEIKFSYGRSWEEEPIKTLIYKVVIK